jgi:type IV pilus assembly protein PilN
MRISLNLASRPYADLKPALKKLRIAMGVLVVLGGLLLLGLRAVHQKAEEARATEQQVQNKIDAINRERQGYQKMMRQPENAALLVQAGALNQIFDEKTFSWTLAMEDLEVILPGEVQVVSLDPSRDTKTGAITLKLRVVGARDRADDLVEHLEHSKHFLMPHIVSETSESTGGPNERLAPVAPSNRFNFELQAEYNSAEPAESKAEEKQEKKQEEKREEKAAAASAPSQKKPMATGKQGGKSAAPLRTIPPSSSPAVPPSGPPSAPGAQPGRALHMGPFRPNPNGNPNRNPNPNPNPNSNPGGPR